MPIYEKNSREFRLLSNIKEYLIDEFNDHMMVEKKVKLAIINSKWDVHPQGTINDLYDNGLAKKIENGIITIKKEKGGEKMEINNYETRFTPGEVKVAQAVLDHFGTAFKMGRTPSRMVFESCIEGSFKKIKNGKTATTKLINGGYLQEKEGNIHLGEKGREYLSL